MSDNIITGTIHAPKDAIEELRKMANETNEYKIFVPVGGNLLPVATITRDKDCPKELFDKVMNELING